MDIEKGMSSAVDSVERISNDGSSKSGTPKPIEIPSEECASDGEDSEDGSSLFHFFGSIFNMPFRFLKRCADEDPDPKTIKVRKPDLSAMPKSKRGMLKNLIKVPDQPTLDSFYKKKMSSGSAKKS